MTAQQVPPLSSAELCSGIRLLRRRQGGRPGGRTATLARQNREIKKVAPRPWLDLFEMYKRDARM